MHSISDHQNIWGKHYRTKGRNRHIITIMADFNTPHLINEDIGDLNNTIDQRDLINIYKTCY